MKMILKTALIVLFSVLLVNLAFPQVGIFETHGDVGQPKLTGKAIYFPDNQTYELNGAGENIWDSKDQFHYLYKELSGDFILRAHVQFVGDGVNPHRKIGWMVRKSLETDAAQVNAVVHGDGLTSLQYRKEAGLSTEEIRSADQAPDVIQLERKGNKYIVSTAKFGELFTSVELPDLNLGDSVYVGLFICSHDADVIEKATFSNVRIVVPEPEGFQQYREFLGSNLEVMDIATGHRQILHQYTGSFQAPNWTMDGQSLIYNQEGLLYRFDLNSLESKVIDTDFANGNNNDHVISFDGKQIAISDNSKGQSLVYTVPIEGGHPELITEEAPSYLHGWSPDGKDLLFTGQRNNEFDVYKIDIATKTEKRLTDAPGLDDGPEFSPDGAYIYFNSSRSGTMQLYRMKPDGREQKQLTFDAYNDWFPHISPDGKWMVFISFPPEVDAGAHPFYKRVYLRLMPTDLSSEPKVIAYLYGGQGTINVPSWSPDSKKIAFVSNTKME